MSEGAGLGRQTLWLDAPGGAAGCAEGDDDENEHPHDPGMYGDPCATGAASGSISG